MGSLVYPSFLLPSLLSGRMTLKMIVVLCLTLVIFIEANPVSMGVPEDFSWEDDVVDGSKEWNPELENDRLLDALNNNSNESEDTTEDSQQVEDIGPKSERRKRTPCFRMKGVKCRVLGVKIMQGMGKWD